MTQILEKNNANVTTKVGKKSKPQSIDLKNIKSVGAISTSDDSFNEEFTVDESIHVYFSIS